MLSMKKLPQKVKLATFLSLMEAEDLNSDKIQVNHRDQRQKVACSIDDGAHLIKIIHTDKKYTIQKSVCIKNSFPE